MRRRRRRLGVPISIYAVGPSDLARLDRVLGSEKSGIMVANAVIGQAMGILGFRSIDRHFGGSEQKKIWLYKRISAGGIYEEK
jgi:hypothetical protein